MTQPVTPRSTAASRSEADCRCVCGSLVARLVDDGVEIKCRRCKRTLVLPLGSVAPERSGSDPSRREAALRETG